MVEYLSFSLIVTLLVMSPGPNGILVIKTSSQGGYKEALLNIVGLVSGIFVQASLVIFGVASLLQHSEYGFMILQDLGAAYLFYTGLKMIIASFRSPKESKPCEQEESKSKYKLFVEGLFTQCSNPKGMLFYLAAFPNFLNTEHFTIANAYLFAGIHASILFIWFSGIVFLMSKVKSNIQNAGFKKWVNRAAGCAMLLFSFLLLTQSI